MLKADIIKESIYDIDYKALKKEGIKALVFDLDNTIASYEENKPSKEAIALIEKLKKDFDVYILSNNWSKRVKHFGNIFNVKAFSMGLKPLTHKLKRIQREKGYQKSEMLMIGDQLLTDIFGAKRFKIKAIYVHPISKKEPFTTKVNRLLEKLFKGKAK